MKRAWNEGLVEAFGGFRIGVRISFRVTQTLQK